MAITTLDGAIAGMQPPQEFYKIGTAASAAGVFYTPFYAAGYPGAAAVYAGGLVGASLTTYAGQIPWTNPVSGNSYLARFSGTATIAGSLYLVDRLWHNSIPLVTTTTAQTVGSAAFPARDSTGTTNGAGVYVGLEITATIGTAAPVTNTTMSYTNSLGTAGQTATIASVNTAATKGSFFPFQLAAGDAGVRAIASVTLGTSYVSGTFGLVAYRLLARLDLNLANSGWAVDALTGGFVQMYSNTVPQLLFMPSATTATNFSGQLIVTQG